MIFENTLTFATLFSTLASLARSTCLEPPSTPDCSYQFFHGRWVCHSNTLKDNYIEAQSHCESFGGKLATINNKWDFKSVNEIHRIHGTNKPHYVGLEPISDTVSCQNEECANQVMSVEKVVLASVDYMVAESLLIEPLSGCARIKDTGFIHGTLATKCLIEERLFICMSTCSSRCDEDPPNPSDHMTFDYDSDMFPEEGTSIRKWSPSKTLYSPEKFDWPRGRGLAREVKHNE
ncbi:uncharacterized protein LOC131893579 isoform X2 [Tigriopus californicus]|uniref:uncharacterized protein LOC131893579 isoform X2 n=1 Tax=Tigriopus californicus TaxID=6832 RepID=UPI0027DA7D2D|nr:uncharacterized protein LOC131893579 isoform X2 [Tigriopus californicus]XP_059099632.1 uncharacterized protein LOC131893579 isoform X2 [Tigriopus californicus]